MDKCGICLKPAVQLFETGKDGVYACFKCQPLVPEISIGENTTDQSDQPRPQSSNTDEDGDQSYYCPICHKTFQKNMQLQNHLRNHRAERRFVCTYCNKAFSQSNNLRAHLRIHTNERPFKCSECGKAFTQVTNLNNHVRLHTGERPFVCPEPGCDKAYAQVTNLNQHRKRHLSGRPIETTYDCKSCGEQFQQRNHLYNHRCESHGEAKSVRGPSQRRTCMICDLGFPNERLLQAHLRQHVLSVPVHHEQEEDDKGVISCVFSSCGMQFESPHEHTEHLLRAHQLRVLSKPQGTQLPRRGRPPKTVKDPIKDPLDLKDIKDNTEYHEVKITKQQYLPKLKIITYSKLCLHRGRSIFSWQTTININSTMDRWSEKIAVVTGASAGIGAAISVALADAGLTVVGLARRANLIDNLKSSVKGKGTIHSRMCDVSKLEEVAATFKWIEATLGPVQILVNNAGVIFNGNSSDLGRRTVTDEQIMTTIDVNYKGPIFCTRHAISSIRKNGTDGHIININSIAGHYIPFSPMFNVYPSTKHAITGFTQTLLNEIADTNNNIKVTSISPGLVATQIAGNLPKDQLALKPKDIADAVVYVLSTPPNVNIAELTITSVGEKRL
ncbi:hypothetical protein K1T71_011163 [Dendrolimus kikuchii]|uniref:Uncharacterized protein n=1 Tax=Dendrolimus kikuchii TaxID=765133 RepID=A0ACC1CNC8_9NEOP|nr:hypothetical protein K1T71_011163 [Dendrolimus kikuchii]